jgi:3-methyladenine DNA glycosylase AlkC
MSAHPISRFVAPSSIQTGSSLADLLGPLTIRLIAESFGSDFDQEGFLKAAIEASTDQPLKARAQAIGATLRAHLPGDDLAALERLVRALGPPLSRTEDNGLQGLFYMPHSAALRSFASTTDDRVFAAGIAANLSLTTRFTAEFSIRAYLDARLDQTLAALQAQLHHPNPHIRRLISEGTRPRLPWASHLRPFRDNPGRTLPLIEALRDDESRYVTRSVANHLGDIGKDHPEVLFQTCTRWLDDIETSDLSASMAKERRWIVRHAVRHPAKKRVPAALALRVRAAPGGDRGAASASRAG